MTTTPLFDALQNFITALFSSGILTTLAFGFSLITMVIAAGLYVEVRSYANHVEAIWDVLFKGDAKQRILQAHEVLEHAKQVVENAPTGVTVKEPGKVGPN